MNVFIEALIATGFVFGIILFAALIVILIGWTIRGKHYIRGILAIFVIIYSVFLIAIITDGRKTRAVGKKYELPKN